MAASCTTGVRNDLLRPRLPPQQHIDGGANAERPSRRDTRHHGSRGSQGNVDGARMSKRYELQRDFQELCTIGFATTVMGLFWSLLWTYAGQAFVVLSLAELASMVPDATGQHQRVSWLAPQRYQRALRYTAGWLATIAWQSTSATDCVIISDILQALITLNSPEYLPTRWAGTLLTLLTAMVLSAFNVFAAQHISILEGVFMTCHVFAVVPIFVTLWVMVDPKKSISEAFFQTRDNGGGWPSSTLSMLVGQISCIYAVSGCDSSVHRPDEVDSFAVAVPRGIFWSFVLNLPLAFIMLVTYCINFGSTNYALSGHFPPFVAVFQNALHTASVVTAFTSVILVLLIMITISALAATSRQTFAFARDNGLPFSQYLSSVLSEGNVPVNAIFATASTTAVLSLLRMGSKRMMNTTLALSCAAHMATSSLSIGTLLLRRLGKQRLPRARWSLGPLGLPINCCALVYATWAFFWSLWPPQYPVTAPTFNWASVLLLAVLGYATCMYQAKMQESHEDSSIG